MTLLIFDCDGVLVDSEVIALNVLAQMLAELGQPMDITACREQFMGRSTNDVLTEVESMLGHPLPPELGERMKMQLFHRLRRELKPVRDAGKVIAQLPYKVCVASSSPPDRIALSLAVTGLSPLFAGRIFSASDVPHGKPAPDLFLHAAAQLHAKPAETIVIEDSPLGVTAALRAGMRVIGFVGGSHADALLARALSQAGAHEIVGKMSDLPQAIENLRAGADAAVAHP